MISAAAIPLSTAPSLGSGADQAPVANNDLKAAAQQFEAIFIRQLLAAARASDFGGNPLFSGPGLKQFNAMYDDHIAKAASESGAFGFSRLIEMQLAQQIVPETQAKRS